MLENFSFGQYMSEISIDDTNHDDMDSEEIHVMMYDDEEFMRLLTPCMINLADPVTGLIEGIPDESVNSFLYQGFVFEQNMCRIVGTTVRDYHFVRRDYGDGYDCAYQKCEVVNPSYDRELVREYSIYGKCRYEAIEFRSGSFYFKEKRTLSGIYQSSEIGIIEILEGTLDPGYKYVYPEGELKGLTLSGSMIWSTVADYVKSLSVVDVVVENPYGCSRLEDSFIESGDNCKNSYDSYSVVTINDMGPFCEVIPREYEMLSGVIDFPFFKKSIDMGLLPMIHPSQYVYMCKEPAHDWETYWDRCKARFLILESTSDLLSCYGRTPWLVEIRYEDRGVIDYYQGDHIVCPLKKISCKGLRPYMMRGQLVSTMIDRLLKDNYVFFKHEVLGMLLTVGTITDAGYWVPKFKGRYRTDVYVSFMVKVVDRVVKKRIKLGHIVGEVTSSVTVVVDDAYDLRQRYTKWDKLPLEFCRAVTVVSPSYVRSDAI